MIELDVLDEADAKADAASQKQAPSGDRVWRSFGDLRGDEALEKRREQEFMPGASEPPTKASRRTFMKIMGASMAMAGLAACRRPEENILPYARKPEEVIPGVPRYYATAMPFRGVARGLLVDSHEGRPTKVEGNPEHPLTQGTTSGFAQASVLNLYDPWRSKTIRHQRSDAGRDELMRQFGQLASGDTRLAVMMEETASPAVAKMREQLREAYPQLRWIEYAPEGDDPVREGMQQATGRPARPFYSFDEADVIVSLDADFLSPTRRNYVSNTRTFAASRRLESPSGEMSRLYCAESSFSLTGGQADHRLQMRPTKVAAFAQALASQMGAGGGGNATRGSVAGTLTNRERAFVKEMAKDLQRAGDRGVVLAGEAQPPEVHALAMRLNRQLGAVGSTVHLMDTGEGSYTPLSQELPRLIRDMNGGRVDALMMIGANPLYDLPQSMGFRDAMSSVATTIHAGLHRNETAQAADWHVPRSHYLESWGDARAYDGTVSLMQPLIEPLYDSMSDLELLHALATGRSRNGYDLLLAQYQKRMGASGRNAGGGNAGGGNAGGGNAGGSRPHGSIAQNGPRSDFDRQWRRILHRGFVPGTQYSGAPKRQSKKKQQQGAGFSFENAGGNRAAPSPQGYDSQGAAPGDGASQNPKLAVAATDTSAADTSAALPDTSGISRQQRGGRSDSLNRRQSFSPSQNGDEQNGDEEGYEVVIGLDPSVLAGRFSNNAWMQELPDPITKLVWENVAVMSERTVNELDLDFDYGAGQFSVDVVRLSTGQGSVELPIWMQPGFPDGTIGLTTGYGRNIEGPDVGMDKGWFRNLTDAYDGVYYGDPIANGAGRNVAPLRGAGLGRIITGVQVEKTGDDYQVVSTQDHGSMEGRPLVRRASMDEYRANPNFAEDEVETLGGADSWDDYPTLWGQDDHPSNQPSYQDSDFYKNQWGMAVDLNTCTGCNACMVACQSENNVQVVGKDQVSRGREMHWLRLDRYYVTPGKDLGYPSGEEGFAPEGGYEDEEAGGEEAAQQQEESDRGDIDGNEGGYDEEVLRGEIEMVVQPVMCQHCENAPCESVCPVAATVHSPDGTNQMVYNRCIGTRYCSNNCPYKVRRFNFYNWSSSLPAEAQMAQNPNVTVRSRGVMEKCSFCVQRIRENQTRADNENRALEDGDVLTACQQVCPADALTFGDLNDPTSEVNRQKKNTRNYKMLAELDVKPRLSYLGRVANPNPALQDRLDALAGRSSRPAGTH